jgi:hypothetical protein
VSSAVVTALIGVGGVLVGAALAGGITGWQNKVASAERTQTRREQNLIAAFQYFDGGTQRRSVGLSIIEAPARGGAALSPWGSPVR